MVSLSGNVTPLTQQRRLAEFATVLGDYKLAIPIWEVVRKEGKGGSVSTDTSHPSVGVSKLTVIVNARKFYRCYSLSVPP